MGKAEGKRSPWRGLVSLVGLLVLIAVAVAAYYKTSGFLDANGTWYGPLRITSGSVTVSLETYMDVSTSFLGGISGTGTFCAPLPFNHTVTFDYSVSGDHAFELLGHGRQPPITLTAEYTVPLILGFSLPIGPSLQLRGDATSDSFHLTGGGGRVATSLQMMHGTRAAFTSACKSLSPLG
jgi:hypothetical protein